MNDETSVCGICYAVVAPDFGDLHYEWHMTVAYRDEEL